MSEMNFRRKCSRLGHAFLLVSLCVLLLTAVSAQANGPTILVAAPNGSDDTASIQAAFDACVARGPNCTVQLRAGKYFTRQIVVNNFQGVFKGMGMGASIITALPNLPVSLIIPVNGSVRTEHDHMPVLAESDHVR